jgi:hypothetical protein
LASGRGVLTPAVEAAIPAALDAVLVAIGEASRPD